MRPDVLALRQFYATALGRLAARLIGARLGLDVADGPHDKRLLALGYGLPYLTAPASNADGQRVIAFMPERQGAVLWPEDGANCVVLGDDMALPFSDALFDAALVVHALEFVDHARGLLGEIWRVLAPGGMLVLVAPNRRSIWSRMENTPFGNGRPFSRGQLAALLTDSLLSPVQWCQALYM
ncbi:MAG: SAM-dependent methyltransferase, partial [Alphaproteobacteria bacterium]